MRRALIVAFVFLISLALLSEQVRADQVLYEDFELSLNIYHDPTDASANDKYGDVVTVYSFTLSFSEKRYLSAVTLNFSINTDSGVSNDVYIYVNGQEVGSRTYTGPVSRIEPFTFAPIYSDSFTIEIKAKLNGYDDGSGNLLPSYFNLYDTWVYTTKEPVQLKSKLTELKYFPPGAEDTPQGLLLNQTEIELNKTYTLGEGAIAFWLKWDGSKNIKITDSIGIDSNGYLYVKNSDGTTYTLEGVNLPVGVYVPAYVGWKNGEGYIMLNTTKVSLNWAGNLTVSKIGDVDQESATIIDEFKLWNTYIPPDQILYESLKDQYTLLYNNQPISIEPEGGTSLGALDVSFLGENLTVLNTTTLSAGQKTAIVPNGTFEVVITRDNVQRTFLINNISEIVFPATDTTIAVLNIKITPGTWDYFIAKTLDGKVATAVKLNDNSAGFEALVGHQYLFIFRSGNITRVRTYTVSGSENLDFYIEDLSGSLTPPIDVTATYTDGLITVSYYDSQQNTNYLNVTITGYEDFKKAWQIHDEQEGSWGLYVLRANGTADYAEVTIVANVSGELRTFKRTVYLGASGKNVRPPFPTTLIPPALVFLAAALVGMFVFNEPALMLLGGAAALGIVTVLGWIPAVPGLIAVLSLLGVLGLVLVRR